jgi:hypothetical protein
MRFLLALILLAAGTAAEGQARYLRAFRPSV